MKVALLKNPHTYSGYFFYIRGTWNAIPDVNTLIDTGTNDFVLSAIEDINAGVGKRKVDLVILTHEHFDHAGGLKYVVEKYNPEVIACKKLPFVTQTTYDGMKVKMGDVMAEILHTPGHSNDSICIYSEETESIFVGDFAYNIKSPGGSYGVDFVEALEKLCSLKISTLYSGHDEPLTENASDILKQTYYNVIHSKIIK